MVDDQATIDFLVSPLPGFLLDETAAAAAR
jgi:hypothetical protein